MLRDLRWEIGWFLSGILRMAQRVVCEFCGHAWKIEIKTSPIENEIFGVRLILETPQILTCIRCKSLGIGS